MIDEIIRKICFEEPNSEAAYLRSFPDPMLSKKI